MGGGGGGKAKKKLMQGETWEKINSCTASSPEKKVLAYGNKYSCKGSVIEEKFVQLENSPTPPHNFSNGPSLSKHLNEFIACTEP